MAMSFLKLISSNRTSSRKRKPADEERLRAAARERQRVYRKRNARKLSRARQLHVIYCRTYPKDNDAERVAELFDAVMDKTLMLELGKAIIAKARTA
jgi:hypothetical protein